MLHECVEKDILEGERGMVGRGVRGNKYIFIFVFTMICHVKNTLTCWQIDWHHLCKAKYQWGMLKSAEGHWSSLPDKQMASYFLLNQNYSAFYYTSMVCINPSDGREFMLCTNCELRVTSRRKDSGLYTSAKIHTDTVSSLLLSG